MQGAGLLIETLSQYSALMVLERLRGEGNIRNFLQFQLDRYLSERRTQVAEEEPLVSVGPNQDHIAYGKGALALYLLQERMGEEAVNRALRRFVDKYRFTVAPYPRSIDLVAFLQEEATTPEDQALITDLFERITLYDLKVKDATTRQAGDSWVTTLTVAADKYYAGGKGEETKAKLDEAIEIGLFEDRPGLGAFDSKDVIVMGRQKLRNGEQKITVRTSRKPEFAGVDPYNFYIDRNSDDNVKEVTVG